VPVDPRSGKRPENNAAATQVETLQSAGKIALLSALLVHHRRCLPGTDPSRCSNAHEQKAETQREHDQNGNRINVLHVVGYRLMADPGVKPPPYC
jgi:hypothetical protein